MLSILIPTYKFNVTDLCLLLHKQCMNLGLVFEIIVMDDGSPQECVENLAPLHEYDSIKVILLDNNIGRAAIRNKMSDIASFDNLLFLDADSMPESRLFIKHYMDNLHKADLLCGGRIYQDEQPEDKQFLLHWKYGRQREMITAHIRNKSPYHGFQTNNFLIKKSAFNSIGFDESINSYGHEDTLFGHQCKDKGVSIIHIDNPAYHIGLEPAHIFLEKSILAINNLKDIKSQYPSLSTKLTKWTESKPTLLIYVVKPIIAFSYPVLSWNIKSRIPLLICLDLIKLHHYLK